MNPCLLAALLLLSVLPAHAGGGKDKGVCPSVKELKKHIFICGDNSYGAKKARECSDFVLAGWRAAAAELAPRLARDAGGRQDAAEAKAADDYRKTVAKLDEQIANMQKHARLIGDYTLPMMDDPNSTGDSTSLDCFNSEFHAVQDVVNKLEDEIIRALELRDKAEDLQISAGERQKSFSALAARLQAAAGGGAVVPSGKEERSFSDVTGLPGADKAAAGAGEAAGGLSPAPAGGNSVDSAGNPGGARDGAIPREDGPVRWPAGQAGPGARSFGGEAVAGGALSGTVAPGSLPDGAQSAASRGGILAGEGAVRAALGMMNRRRADAGSPMPEGRAMVSAGSESRDHTQSLAFPGSASEESIFAAVKRYYRGTRLFQDPSPHR